VFAGVSQPKHAPDHSQAATAVRTSSPTKAAMPQDFASVVADVLAFVQQVDASSLLQSPLHMPLAATVKPDLHEFGSLPLPLWTLKPTLGSVHFSLQQILSSEDAHGLPTHLAVSANVVSLGQVFDSLVVAPFSLKPLVQDC